MTVGPVIFVETIRLSFSYQMIRYNVMASPLSFPDKRSYFFARFKKHFYFLILFLSPFSKYSGPGRPFNG